MPTISRFPVAFRSWLDGASFKLAAFFVVLYVITPQFAEPVSNYLKYLFAALLMLCFAGLAATRRMNRAPGFLFAPLILAAIGCVSLAYSMFIATTTYSSALIPLIIVAMPLLVSNRAALTDSAHIARYLMVLCSVAAVAHVLWQGVATVLRWEDDGVYYGFLMARGHTGTIMIVNLMIVSGLFRRRKLFALSILLAGVSLVLRPTSTLVFVALFAVGLVVLDRLRFRNLLRIACAGLALAVVAENLAILESGRFADAVYSIEPLVKQQALDAQDNNEFRLGVLAAARDEMQQHSLLVGKAFIGDVAVPSLVRLPWVPEAPMLTIHSDYVIMIVQGGLVGYALFVAFFIGTVWLCGRGAKLAHRARDRGSEVVFDALQAMNAVFMLYIAANPMMQQPQYALPYLIMVPLTVFLARQQPGFAPVRRQNAVQPSYPPAFAAVRRRTL